MVESFTTTNRYFDDKHYPRGFPHHGDFTTKEAQLLECHGYAFNELDLGKHEPITKEEKLFVTVCRSECEPVTETERVWSEYMTCIKRPRRFHIFSDGRPQVEGAENYTNSDD